MFGKNSAVVALSLGLIVSLSPSPRAATSAASAYAGPYVGLEIAGAVGASRKSFNNGSTTGDFAVSGFGGGGDAGYNWTSGPLVFGMEGDLSGGDVGGHAGEPNPHYIYNTDNHFLATLRPRLGYVIGPSILPYVTGGLAVGDLETRSHRNGPGGVDHDVIEPGWDIGAGIETALPWPHWRAKAEYLHVRLADADTSSDIGQPTTTSFAENVLRLGINYAF